MAAVDVLELINKAQGNAQGIQAERERNLIEIQNSGSATLGLMEQSSEASRNVNYQKLSAKKQAQDNARQIASDFGGNLQDETTSIVGKLGQVFRLNTLKSIDTKERVAELDSQDFMSNPVAWIANQFEADSLDSEAAGYDDLASKASSSMQELNAIISSGAASQAAIAQTITDESIAQTLEFDSIASNIKIEELRGKNATTNIAALNAIQQGDKEAIALETAKLNVIASEESRQFARDRNMMAWTKHKETLIDRAASLELAQASLKGAKNREAITSLQLEVAQANKKAADTSIDIMLEGAKVLKLPFPKGTGKDTIKLMSRTPAGKAKADILLRVGLDKLNGRTVIGVNPAQSWQIINEAGSPAAWKDSEQFRDNVNYLENSFNKLFTPDPETKEALVTGKMSKGQVTDLHKTEILKDVAHWTSNAEIEGSRYAAPKLAEVAGIGAVKATKFYEVVIVPELASNSGDASFSRMLALGESAVALNALNTEDLILGLTAIYGSVPEYNNMVMGLSELGFPLQRNYNVQVKRLGRKSAVDASNETKLRNYILERSRFRASSSPQSIGTAFTGLAL